MLFSILFKGFESKGFFWHRFDYLAISDCLGWLHNQLLCLRFCDDFGSRGIWGAFLLMDLTGTLLGCIDDTRFNCLYLGLSQITRGRQAKAHVNDFSSIFEFDHPCTEVIEVKVGPGGRVEELPLLFLKANTFEIVRIDLINVRVVLKILFLHLFSKIYHKPSQV